MHKGVKLGIVLGIQSFNGMFQHGGAIEIHRFITLGATGCEGYSIGNSRLFGRNQHGGLMLNGNAIGNVNKLLMKGRMRLVRGMRAEKEDNQSQVSNEIGSPGASMR